jgi:N-acetylmuramoyl-L-alanine amidase
LRRKLGILGLLVLLVCAVIGSQKAGEYLHQNYLDRETKETAAAAGAKEKQVVVVDAGHGGFDSGKVGVNQALEKDLNLQIANKVKTMLEKQGIKVIMTRKDENSLASSKVEDMKTRVSIINQEKPSLAVSIHQNSYTQESIHGAQVFYFTHSKEGEKSAKVMQEALLAADPENTRQAKANDTYYMLKKTNSPVIIVECGFLSNKAEADKLTTEEYQNALTEAICKGVQDYLSQ